MTVKEINITFLIETDDILDTINAINQEVQETWPLESEDKATLTLIHSFENTYSISYHIKLGDKDEPADNTESEAEASDSSQSALDQLSAMSEELGLYDQDGLEPLPLEF